MVEDVGSKARRAGSIQSSIHRLGFISLSTNGSNDFRREGSYVSTLQSSACIENARRSAYRPKHNILDSEITIGSYLWLNGLRRSKIKFTPSGNAAKRGPRRSRKWVLGQLPIKRSFETNSLREKKDCNSSR